MGSLSLRASLQTYWYQFLKRDLLPQHFSCMSVCKLRVAQWNPWGYWGEMVFVFWWPQYCCGLLLRQPLLSSRWLEQHDPVMLRKEDMILISLCKHMVRFLKPANQIYFWCTFTGPVLGEGNKWIWPKGWHLSPHQPWQRQQQHWLSLYTWAWISALQGYNTVLNQIISYLGAYN